MRAQSIREFGDNVRVNETDVFFSAMTPQWPLLLCDGCTGCPCKMYYFEALKTDVGAPATEVRP